MLERWHVCTSQLEAEVAPQLFRTWIKPLVFLGFDESERVLRLGVPNQFKLNWIRNQFGQRIGELVARHVGDDARVAFEVCRAPADSAPAQPASGNGAVPALGHRWPASDAPLARDHGQGHGHGHGYGQSTSRTVSGVARTAAAAAALATTAATASVAPPVIENNGAPDLVLFDRSHIHRDLSFDNFVTGKANQMARAAALQVVEKPGHAYNPLFLYGGVGLGKTHLIHAVGNAILERNPVTRVRYIHAQEYFDEMVRAIQRKTSDQLKSYYQSLDLLLIDDIQFLSGKARTQEEFFYTFEALFSAKKQIIITCDTYPKEISGIEERLISRFDSGLIVAIEPPELEMRVAILLKKAERESIPLPEDVAFFIAKHLRSNVRELEGALTRVTAFANFRSREITLDMAREALADLLTLNRRQISIEFIQKTVSDYFKIKVGDMYSKRRPANIALPRQVAMYLTKELTQKSLPEIGEAFGGRDHTTVLHAVRKITEVRQHNAELNHALHVLEQTLRG